MKKALFAALATSFVLAVTTPAFALSGDEQQEQHDMQELQRLLFKRAQKVLPVPSGDIARSISETKRIGTSPEGCHKLIGTRHDAQSHGTYQLWRRCSDSDAPDQAEAPRHHPQTPILSPRPTPIPVNTDSN